MEILYRSRKRRKSEEEEAIGATCCERLDDLLQRSDFVMLAVSLTPQARGLIGKRELSAMERTATLSTSAAVRAPPLCGGWGAVGAVQEGPAPSHGHPLSIPRQAFP